MTLLLAVVMPTKAHGGEPHSMLDRSTGTTLQITSSPWILALDQPLLAANARDYVGLYALEASNGGKRRHFIAAFFWSTVPGRNRHAGTRPGLRLLLDDREIALTPVEGAPRDSGIGSWPLRTPGRDALLMLYAVEPALLRQMGHVARLRLRPLPDSDLPPEVWFEAWRNAAGAFREFGDAVIGAP